jgi:hypothetical protein
MSEVQSRYADPVAGMRSGRVSSVAARLGIYAREMIRLIQSVILWSSRGVAMMLDGEAQRETLIFLVCLKICATCRQPGKVTYPLPGVSGA